MGGFGVLSRYLIQGRGENGRFRTDRRGGGRLWWVRLANLQNGDWRGRILLWFLCVAFCLEGAQLGKRLLGMAPAASFVTAQEVEAPALGQRFECDGDADQLVHFAAVLGNIVFLIVHLEVDHGGFYAQRPPKAPACVDHFDDELQFDITAGWKRSMKASSKSLY